MKRGEDWGGFVFPKWTNMLRPVLAATLVLVPAYLVVLLAYGASPRTTNIGYRPVQPVPYSHALHAGQLGIDCRYCHNTVEMAAYAAVPPTQTCMNCHARIRTTSPKLLPVRESYATGRRSTGFGSTTCPTTSTSTTRRTCAAASAA